LPTLQTRLTALDSQKNARDAVVSALPAIQARNKTLRAAYSEKLDAWTSENEIIITHNAGVKAEKEQRKLLGEKITSTTKAMITKMQQAQKDTDAENTRLTTQYETDKKALQSNIKVLTERIKNGNAMIAEIVPCSNCGFVHPDSQEKITKYQTGVKELQAKLDIAQAELDALTVPERVLITADTTVEESILENTRKLLSVPVAVEKPVTPKPEEPNYESEEIPAFDQVSYDDVKLKISAYSEEGVKEIRDKIASSTQRILSLETKVREIVITPVDYSSKTILDGYEKDLESLRTQIKDKKSAITVCESKISDIDKQREGLKAYDARIAEYESECGFWSDMKVKWGPGGIPARILEHTGPYVDEIANTVLAKYYPVYKLHSETTKKDASGKKDLEIFNISVFNRETGREKPINCISGEERNFINIALRYAFREVNKQNSLEKWTMQFEDEPDAHVSTDYLMSFWNMIEGISDTKKLCIAHSPEVKHRSAVSIDIKDLG
jgi:hypothetical protein